MIACVASVLASDTSLQEIVLDFFFELLNIKTPKWYQTFIDGRRLTSKVAFELLGNCTLTDLV
jgi:hypothetical protein